MAIDTMQTLRRVLMQLIGDIDAGNSNISEEDMTNIINAVHKYSHNGEYLTKYQACKLLNGISRATFDNLVAKGKLPMGEKLYAGDNNLFWKYADIMAYRKVEKGY